MAPAFWTTFRRITIPLISPVLLYNLVICLIATFQYFTQAYVLTNGRGDPNNATLFINLAALPRGLRVQPHGLRRRRSRGCSSRIVLALTLALFGFARNRVYYAGGER